MRDVHIMDIAMNLARIGNWAADDFDGKQKRISMFLEQTNAYLDELDISVYPTATQRTLSQFSQLFHTLRVLPSRVKQDRFNWADDMLTWSNILIHRAKLAET